MSVVPALRALRVNAIELIRQPGAVKPISVTLGTDAREALELGDPRLAGDVTFDGEAVSSIDGVAVHGELRVPWSDACRRCLAPVEGVNVAQVDEVFQPAERAVSTPERESIPFDGDQIDLAPVIREYVLLELPDGPLCRDDCAGICPVCGIDRNTGSCDCDTTVRDERWSALDQLRIDEP